MLQTLDVLNMNIDLCKDKWEKKRKWENICKCFQDIPFLIFHR